MHTLTPLLPEMFRTGRNEWRDSLKESLFSFRYADIGVRLIGATSEIL
jgi:hypothetical protein